MNESIPPALLEYKSAAPENSRGSAVGRLWETSGMLVVLVLLIVLCSIFVPNFLSWTNIRGLLQSMATIGMVSCTMLFCLASGDFDLSVGSVAALGGVVGCMAVNATHSIPLGLAMGLGTGAVVGFINGFVIAKIGINALITTLATMQIARGIAFLLTGTGEAIGIRVERFFELGMGNHLGVPHPLWFMVGMFVVFGVLLNRTVFGRNTLAIGGNPEAARLAGVPVVWCKIAIFTLQGAVAAFAGIVSASKLTSASPASFKGLELDVISACVLGGVSLTGGIGSMFGVVVGVLIMGTVTDAMLMQNINSFWQMVTGGGILMAAVLVDRLKQSPEVGAFARAVLRRIGLARKATPALPV